MFFDSTNMLGSGNRSFNATQSELKFAHGQESVVVESRVILRSPRKYTFAAILCVQFGSQQGHHIRKYYSYCNHVNSLLIYVVFQSEYPLFVQPVYLSFDKNTYHKLQTVSRRAILLQAENAAPRFIQNYTFNVT